MALRQKLFLILVLMVNVVLWCVPSNVYLLVVDGSPVLCGRYSREHFSANLTVAIVSAISLFVNQARAPAARRRRLFIVLSATLGALIALGLVDVALRRPAEKLYVPDGASYHRPPNQVYRVSFEDRPTAARTYPGAGPGYPTREVTLRTDARGFRNSEALAAVDVVVIGDSFAEGTGVSDGECWPARLARRTGKSVYNLGMSGYAPQAYRAALERYGLPLRPAIVICLIYEGNDLRPPLRTEQDRDLATGDSLERWFKDSPIRQMLDRAMVSTFGPIGAMRRDAALDALSWMPIRVPSGSEGRSYAFKPVRFRPEWLGEPGVRERGAWVMLEGLLGEIRDLCRAAGAELVLVLAPAKAHVVMPSVWEQLPSEKVRSFLQIRSDEPLPPAGELMPMLREFLEVVERALAAWCTEESVPFFSPTEALRRAAEDGRQVYFSYDNHWTPEGHEVVADALADSGVLETARPGAGD